MGHGNELNKLMGLLSVKLYNFHLHGNPFVHYNNTVISWDNVISFAMTVKRHIGSKSGLRKERERFLNFQLVA